MFDSHIDLHVNIHACTHAFIDAYIHAHIRAGPDRLRDVQLVQVRHCRVETDRQRQTETVKRQTDRGREGRRCLVLDRRPSRTAFTLAFIRSQRSPPLRTSPATVDCPPASPVVTVSTSVAARARIRHAAGLIRKEETGQLCRVHRTE